MTGNSLWFVFSDACKARGLDPWEVEEKAVRANPEVPAVNSYYESDEAEVVAPYYAWLHAQLEAAVKP